MTPLNALTIDVEEYFQVTGFASCVSQSDWDQYPSRVVPATHMILDALERAEVRATFFVLGWVADRHPRLVRTIVRAGHEIASHGYAHQLVTTQAPSQFRDDVRRAKLLLEDQVGGPVTAYRAPSFSIAPDRLWAFEILVEEGFAVDSSVAAGRRASCGHLAPDGRPFTMSTPSGPLTEYPMPTTRRFGYSIPVGGGGYFRLFPYFWTRRALASLNAAGMPFVAYLHPWEFDSLQPRLPVPRMKAFRHYVNLSKTASRFRHLLNDFPFDTLTSSLGQELRPTCAVA